MNMAIERIETEEAPLAVGPYSQGISAGNLVFTAGEIPVDPHTGAVGETIEEQANQALKNVIAVLEAGHVAKDGIVSVTVYLTDIEDFQTVNLIYKDYFGEPYPARSCVEVSNLPKGVKIMVSAIGVRTE
ncbi:endoribonuclease L-PSP [Thermoplasmatales archaeon BRNA1]|nr:endoribonuclease L-PSP [Thermoplasmatales archaeon BRNA1]